MNYNEETIINAAISRGYTEESASFKDETKFEKCLDYLYSLEPEDYMIADWFMKNHSGFDFGVNIEGQNYTNSTCGEFWTMLTENLEPTADDEDAEYIVIDKVVTPSGVPVEIATYYTNIFNRE